MTPRRGRGRRRKSRRNRALSPVVGKTLELGVGVLFVALLTAAFFGGIAPEYRATAGAELGDRTIVAAVERVEAAAPDDRGGRLDRSVAVRLPSAIRGDPYRIVVERGADGPALRLVHPDPAVGGRVRLALPENTDISGSWRSASPSRVLVGVADGRVSVRLVDGNAPTSDDVAAPSDGDSATAATEGNATAEGSA